MNSLQLSYAFGLIQSPLEYKQNKWTCIDDVFSETLKMWNSTFWRLELETSTVRFSDMMYLIKGLSIRSLVFWGCFPFFLNQASFSDSWFWVGNNILKEFYIFRISVKSQYCWYSNFHENSIFSFGEYWSKLLFTSNFLSQTIW